MKFDKIDLVMLATIVAALIGMAYVFLTDSAEAHYWDKCRKYTCKAHVIKPYKGLFASIGSCESGNTNSAHDPSGTYHGRYQFNLGSWRGAGGHGDPHYQSYTEQTYRGVIWLHRNGRSSWPNC